MRDILNRLRAKFSFGVAEHLAVPVVHTQQFPIDVALGNAKAAWSKMA